MSAILRFAGGLHIVAGRIVVEAELDTGAAARRLRKDIAEVFGHPSDLSVIAPGGLRKGSRYVVRVVQDGEHLARQTGLLDGRGRPVRGLSPQVVAGAICDCEAAWRGAFLAHGSLTEPGRSSALEITCPGSEAALALVGAARRLGIASKAREVRGVDRVVVRDGDAIGAMLTRLGAHESRAGLGGAADAPRGPRDRQPAGQLRRRQPAPLGPRRGRGRGPGRSAPSRSSATTSPTTSPRPAGSASTTGRPSLEELGALADPPMTKDAIAGRIRRLLAMADKKAQDAGEPGTEAGLTPDMLAPQTD